MRVSAHVQVLGKVTQTWKDKEGVERLSYTANIVQNNGEIIDKIRLNETQYNNIVVGKVYTLTADYGTGSNGNYLRILDIAEAVK